MLYFVDHPQDIGSRFMLHLVSYAVQSQGFQSAFLILGALDAASYLFYYNLCHGPVSLSVEDFFEGNTPLFGYGLGIPELQKGVKSSLYHVVWV